MLPKQLPSAWTTMLNKGSYVRDENFSVLYFITAGSQLNDRKTC